jgi:hypothetical protein
VSDFPERMYVLLVIRNAIIGPIVKLHYVAIRLHETSFLLNFRFVKENVMIHHHFGFGRRLAMGI